MNGPKKRIGVLMGGSSSERDVSIRTGRAIEASLKRQGWPVVAIDVDADAAERIRREKIELAVVALHGRGGEDGSIQGFLEVMGIPYTGSGILSSAVGMNKPMTKRIFEFHGLPTPRYAVIRDRSARPELPAGLEFPAVVKPASEGSTVGVTIVRKPEEVGPAFREAFRHGGEILIEEYIPGHEITAGVLGDETLPLVEIVPKAGFYDYEAKYTKGMSDYLVPAPLPEGVAGDVRRLALEAHRALGCEGYSRVDFRVTADGRPYLLEVNTLPGMTETSLLPKAALAAGIDYDALVLRIVRSALEKGGGS